MSDTILVVDDDARLARALLTRLRAAGFEVKHAACGQAAIESAAQFCPNVIILDIRLPDMSGFDVCSRIREHLPTRGTPIIFLSANSSTEERRRAGDVGGDAFLAKPCTASELLDTIKHYIGTVGSSEHRRVGMLARPPLLIPNTAGQVNPGQTDKAQETKQC